MMRRMTRPEDSTVLSVWRSASAGIAALLTLASPAAAQAPAATPLVEAVEIRGNQSIPKESLLYYVSVRPGQPYDPIRLRQDFRRLWDTGFLDNLAIDVQDRGRGKLVTFVVVERPRIRIVDYRGSKALSQGDIGERLKKDDAGLSVDGFYDALRARRAEATLKRMLEEQGFPFAQVRREAKPLAGTGLQVSFVIDDGIKALVRDIDFTGNTSLGDSALRRRMMRIKPRRFWNLSWLTGKNVFSHERWQEDQRHLEDFLLDQGHVLSSVGEPALSYEDGRMGLFKRKPVKWLRLAVPITEGPVYRVGDLRFEGLTVFKEADVRPLFKLETGEVYRDSREQKGLEQLRDVYGSRGYVEFTGSVRRTPRAGEDVVDLVLQMEEDKQYRVGRIGFEGLVRTKDKVARRELLLGENDVLDSERLKASVRRLNQLGYFKPLEGPKLHRSSEAADAYDLTFPLEEQSRTQFQAGVSAGGAYGTYYTLSLSTPNFLGGGQTVDLLASRGASYRNYKLGFREPYLFDRPLSAGADVSKTFLQVPASAVLHRPGYTLDQTGGRVSAGRALGPFTRLLVDYSYTVSQAQPLPGDTSQLIDTARRHDSRLAPSLVYSTVDNPLAPRRGVSLAGSIAFSGGPLGGTVDVFEPNLKLIAYVPHTRRTALGLRFEAAWLRPYGHTAAVSPTTGRNGLAFDQRFFLGGDTQVRGFAPFDIGPRDAQGTFVGGNKYVLGSAEYYYDIGRVRVLAFFDAGQAYSEGQGIDLGRLRTSTGVELRFLMPVMNLPIRIFRAWNLTRDPGQPANHTQWFGIGTSF
jgi:outer membrane protein insertion porin family